MSTNKNASPAKSGASVAKHQMVYITDRMYAVVDTNMKVMGVYSLRADARDHKRENKEFRIVRLHDMAGTFVR